MVAFLEKASLKNSYWYLPQNPKKLNVSLEFHTRQGDSMIDWKKYTSEKHFDKNKKNHLNYSRKWISSMGARDDSWVVKEGKTGLDKKIIY